MDKGLKYFSKEDINGQWAHEKMLNVTNASESQNEVSFHAY